jgi:pimeloyl-ACP methyl ester carboxylesterase
MGGTIGLGLAQHAPERVQALIVGGASAYSRRLPSIPEGANAERFISWVEVLVGARASPEYRELLLASDTKALAAAAAQGRPSMEGGLPQMRMPSMFYAGDKDPVFSNARATAERIPHALFITLPGLNHPEAFMRADLVVPHALRFLSRCTLQPSKPSGGRPEFFQSRV